MNTNRKNLLFIAVFFMSFVIILSTTFFKDDALTAEQCSMIRKLSDDSIISLNNMYVFKENRMGDIQASIDKLPADKQGSANELFELSFVIAERSVNQGILFSQSCDDGELTQSNIIVIKDNFEIFIKTYVMFFSVFGGLIDAGTINKDIINNMQNISNV